MENILNTILAVIFASNIFSQLYSVDHFTSLVIERDFTFWIFIIYCRCTLNLSVLLPQSIHFLWGHAPNPTITTVLDNIVLPSVLTSISSSISR
jgi:hypothetical protein